jgi:hypothetical protein
MQGRLLAGCGPVLRLYECGKKKLLRKCEYKRCVKDGSELPALPVACAYLHVELTRIVVGYAQPVVSVMRRLPTGIVSIQVLGSRICVADLQESIHLMKVGHIRSRLAGQVT